nr:hypothetical protein [Candidatus Freyarchaeota archaeon]
MRIDSIAKKTYRKALSAIREVLGVQVQECELFIVEKRELPQIKPSLGERPHIMNFLRGFYEAEWNTIFVVSGYEDDFQTILHEALHSNLCLHPSNSPFWIREGLTETLTEHVLLRKGLSYSGNLLLKEELNFWRGMFKKHREKIIEAYFSKNLKKCYTILAEVTGISHLEKKAFTEI